MNVLMEGLKNNVVGKIFNKRPLSSSRNKTLPKITAEEENKSNILRLGDHEFRFENHRVDQDGWVSFGNFGILKKSLPTSAAE